MENMRTLLIAFLLASSYACAGADITPPVTVIYSHTTADGITPITTVIPWENGLDIGKAIATAGGYSSPPYREISLIRDGDSRPVSPKSILEGEAPINLQPGDRIEIK